MDRWVELFIDLKKFTLIPCQVEEHELLLSIPNHKSKLLVKNYVFNEAHVLLIVDLVMRMAWTEDSLLAGPIFRFTVWKVNYITVILYLLYYFFNTLIFA